MSTPHLPPISDLPHSPDPTLTHTLDLLFEPSPALHALALPLLRTTPFTTYPELIHAVGTRLHALQSSHDMGPLNEILSAHPRLGAKKVDSEISRREQASLGGEEAEILQELNTRYEEAFPGLRYVVFVDSRPRAVIVQNMRERIARGDIELERRDAIQAMCDIAADRAGKLQLAE